LSHVTELVRGLKATGRHEQAKSLVSATASAIAELSKLAERNPAEPDPLLPSLPKFSSTLQQTQQTQPPTRQSPPPPGGRKPDYVINAFVPLRILRAIANLGLSGHAAEDGNLNVASPTL